MKHAHLALLVVASLALAESASASPITYEGRNPNITPGASPLYAGVIDQRASLTRPKDKKTGLGTELSEAELLRRSVLSGLAAHYQSILTGGTSGDGTINFGDGRYATYTTVGGIRTIRFYNLDGTFTEISFPV